MYKVSWNLCNPSNEKTQEQNVYYHTRPVGAYAIHQKGINSYRFRNNYKNRKINTYEISHG